MTSSSAKFQDAKRFSSFFCYGDEDFKLVNRGEIQTYFVSIAVSLFLSPINPFDADKGKISHVSTGLRHSYFYRRRHWRYEFLKKGYFYVKLILFDFIC